MEKLTKRQREVFETIVKLIKENEYPPTLKELAEQLGASSRNTAVKHLTVLDRKGYILWEKNKARGIKVLESMGLFDRDDEYSLPLVGAVTAGCNRPRAGTFLPSETEGAYNGRLYPYAGCEATRPDSLSRGRWLLGRKLFFCRKGRGFDRAEIGTEERFFPPCGAQGPQGRARRPEGDSDAPGAGTD